MNRLISVVVVDIAAINPYQPLPLHILFLLTFQSRILIYASSNIYDDEIAKEQRVFERNIVILVKIYQ